jgi:putative transposase
MPTHWHFVAWPREDGELSRFFGYLGLTHAARWQAAHGAVGTGHVYQSRFKNFLVQRDEHLMWVLRYVERNPLRAGLVTRTQDWRWGSLWAREREGPMREMLSDWPIARPRDWAAEVNRAQSPAEEEAVRLATRRGRPLGKQRWVAEVARKYDLQSTLRPRGRQTGWRKVENVK